MRAPRVQSESTPIAVRLRRVFYGLRTEGTGPAREAAAIGVGVFIGCLPFYGFHLLLCWMVGSLAGLNRLKMYLAANISNPLMAPLAALHRAPGRRMAPPRPLSVDHDRGDQRRPARSRSAPICWSAACRRRLRWRSARVRARPTSRCGVRPRDAWFMELVRRASDRYVGTSVTAWEFARGKLRGDPLYRAALWWSAAIGRHIGGCRLRTGTDTGALCRSDSSLSCGNVAGPANRARRSSIGWSGSRFAPRAAALARQALKDAAEIVQGDARTVTHGGARAILLFDVLHMIGRTTRRRCSLRWCRRSSRAACC